LHIALEIDWFERGDAESGVPNLRFAVSTALQGATARYEIPFGALDRQAAPDQEVPALRWARLSGKVGADGAALVLFNDCKHGHAVNGATLRLNLLRSSYEPDPLPEIDRHLVRLALLPTDGAGSDAALTARAAAHNQPLLAIGTDVHEGPLPVFHRLIGVSGANVALCGLKWAESGEGLVVRLTNTADAPAVAELTCPALLSAQPLDLMERPTGEPRPGEEDAVSVTVPANGLGTWLIYIGD
jgi:alpha-mannosidase